MSHPFVYVDSFGAAADLNKHSCNVHLVEVLTQLLSVPDFVEKSAFGAVGQHNIAVFFVIVTLNILNEIGMRN